MSRQMGRQQARGDGMDEEANSSNDTLLPPESTERYDANEEDWDLLELDLPVRATYKEGETLVDVNKPGFKHGRRCPEFWPKCYQT